MSRIVKNEIRKTMEELLARNREVRLNCNSITADDLCFALESWQNAAIDLGQKVEALCGDGTDIVSNLEMYCELVFRIYEQIYKGEEVKTGFRDLEELLQDTYDLIEHEISDKLEIVFLPYKVAMWDSLESVWEAARGDKACEVYVVPIPYCDKKLDGTPGREHYEGNDFPKYISITDYKIYDLQRRKPDVIFIHNPYDNCNNITTVHPYFYAKNLRTFTEKLVYIPYFVLDGTYVPPGFAVVPGVLYSHYVIVRTENERQEYIRQLKEKVPQIDFSEKILPLGSPKLDRVAHMNREEEMIPREWRARARGKCVVFYNTSLNGILKEKENYLEKMKAVFRSFRDRADAILLWRPHPLMETTAESLGKQIYEQYIRIRQWYLEEQIGIYDDSKDMAGAIAFSDVYYGDSSSLVWLFQKANKRVLLQDVSVCGKGKRMECMIEDIVRAPDCVYLLLDYNLGLWSYFPEKNRCQILSAEIKNQEMEYRCLQDCGEQLILPPYKGEDILVFYKKDRKLEHVFIGNLREKKEEAKYYKGVVTYGQFLYFIGEVESSILKYDCNTREVKVLNGWKEQYLKEFGKLPSVYYHKGEICRVENSFWVALSEPDMVMEYDMETDTARFYQVGDAGEQYVTISYDGSDFWLSGDQIHIVCWNKEQQKIKNYSDFPSGFALDTDCIWNELFSSSLCVGTYVYFAPLKCNMVIRMDVKTEKMECVKKIGLSDVCFQMKRWGETAIFYQILNRTSNKKKEEFIIDFVNRVIKEKIFDLGPDNVDGLEMCFEGNGVIEELNEQSLPCLIKMEGQKNSKVEEAVRDDGYGAQIYHAIKQTLT